MTWAEAFPNLLIGLREGLEGGLVVSILLAALAKLPPRDADRGRRRSPAPIWLGVLAAVALAGSFAAVLTFSTDILSGSGREAVGGLLSVLAVGLVTAMVFWMRHAAAGLSRQLRGEVAQAAALGAGALALTAFLAVGREGLETTLFLWTAVRASGSTLAPLIGAGIGLAVAVALCWLLYRQAVRINLGVFFTRTALLLIVVAAGVLSYGLGDLQEAGLLPGRRWIAFDLSAHVSPDSWWMSILTGITNLAPTMTVLQVVAWLAYLGIVVSAFCAAGRRAAKPTSIPAPQPAATAVSTASSAAAAVAAVAVAAGTARSREESRPVVPVAAGRGQWARLAGRRPWAVAVAAVTAPALAAGLLIAVLPSARAGSATAVTLTKAGCAEGWRTARTGAQTFTVTNRADAAAEITLLDAGGRVVGEIETLAPATSSDMPVTLGRGSYTFKCALPGGTTLTSAPVQADGADQAGAAAVTPLTLADLAGPTSAYQAYARTTLAATALAVNTLETDLRRGDLATAKADWLSAQLSWERVGASYNSFGALGVKVDGLPDGLPSGVNDPAFSGLHRLEYGLWHGQDLARLVPIAQQLSRDLATLDAELGSDELAGDPTALPLRTHEILEDALRDHLSGLDNQGGDAAYAMTYANTEATTAVLALLEPLLTARDRTLVATATGQLAALQRALTATQQAGGQWTPADQVPAAQRRTVNGAIGAVLETLAAVPTLLETPPTR